MLGAKFGWNWPSGSGEEDWKCENNDDGKFWSEKLTWAFGSVVRAKKWNGSNIPSVPWNNSF